MTGERELAPEETRLAFAAMRVLRPHLTSVDDFVARVNGAQRPEGYRLLASFADPDPDPDPETQRWASEGGAAGPSGGPAVVAVGGFRRLHTLAWGDLIYIDDLVTLESHRGRGHAHRLLEWIHAEARRLGCGQIHLDSAPHRHPAHRLYLTERFHISSFHFSRDV
jgi:GNAT superfamily N-acetyltransferase